MIAILTALFTSGVGHAVLGVIGVAGAAIAAWLHGHSVGVQQGSDRATAQAQAVVTQAQTAVQTEQAQADAARAGQEVAERKAADAQQHAQTVEAVSKMTDQEVSDELKNNWSR